MSAASIEVRSDASEVVRLLTPAECEDRARQVGVKPGKAGRLFKRPCRHVVELAYRSRMANADAVAATLVDCLGSYDWAVLWATDLAWGDRSHEASPPPDWHGYAQWRHSQDERRSLVDAPGHEFGAGNDAHLTKLMVAAIYMGWDALVFGHPLRCTVNLSHDDIITLRSQHSLADVTARLTSLGLNRVAR